MPRFEYIVIVETDTEEHAEDVICALTGRDHIVDWRYNDQTEWSGLTHRPQWEIDLRDLTDRMADASNELSLTTAYVPELNQIIERIASHMEYLAGSVDNEVYGDQDPGGNV